jgi:cytochrome c553
MKKTILSLAVVSLLSADTTMCFKKNWVDPSTVETTALDGGKCSSTKSLVDMKKDGWMVEDIKISSGKDGMNFMYVLKKGGNIVLSDADLETRLNAIQDKREADKKVETTNIAKIDGEKIYKNVCSKCHGTNGELSAYNTSKRLNTLSVEDIKVAFRDYGLSQKDNGMAVVMIPFANKYSSSEINNVATYIQSLK